MENITPRNPSIIVEKGMFISTNFDSGNARLISCEDAKNIVLEIEKDSGSNFYQWFHFRLTGAAKEDCRIQIINAGDAAYPAGFENYQAVFSYDTQFWTRVATFLEDGTLTISHTPEFDSVYYAYFAPFPMERHHRLICNAIQSSYVTYSRLGATLDGQDIDLLTISSLCVRRSEKKICWLTARQHPGETMAEWWMEGFLETLLDTDNAVSRALLESCEFHIIANMNPDGSRRGHLRTNAIGINLNRQWHNPSMEKSPEVFLVAEKMKETGVDFMLDVHGDEALPFNFIAGAEGISSWNEDKQKQLDFYKQTLMELSPDFQIEKGYPPTAPGQANLALCTNQVAQTYGCLALTLEMPFKDTVATPDPKFGWSAHRSKKLAEACLLTLHRYISYLAG